MKNERISISNKLNFFRLAKSLTRIDDHLKANVYSSVRDKTLNGVRDILKIAIYNQIEDELEKQYEEY